MKLTCKRTPWVWGFLLSGCLSLSVGSQAAEWEMLFDGSTLVKWRGYRKPDVPEKGWKVEDGSLRCVARGGGGDILTRDQYDHFDLRFEWKVAPGANSGVMYRVSENFGASWHTGPEYQILDDAKHPDGKNPKTRAASLYALIACDEGKELKPVGDWNESRIRVEGSRVEHWLNSKLVVSYDLESPEFQDLVRQSKFKDLPRFAKEPKGHICIQDHGDDVWYRNIRIQRLDPPVQPATSSTAETSSTK